MRDTPRQDRLPLALRSLALMAILSAIGSCSPTLSNTCTEHQHCLAGEECKDGVCVPSDDTTPGDVATDPDVTPGDSGDPRLDETGEEPDITDSQDMDADLDSERGDSGDGDDSEEEIVDGNDLDSEEPTCSDGLERFATQLTLAIQERCFGDEGCDDWDPAPVGQNCATGFRANQLIEMPLRNGLIDESVLAYFSFDNAENRFENYGLHPVEMDSHGTHPLGIVNDGLEFTSTGADIVGLPGELTHWTLAFWFKPEPIFRTVVESVLFSSDESSDTFGSDTEYLDILYSRVVGEGEDLETSLTISPFVLFTENVTLTVGLGDYGDLEGWYHLVVTGAPNRSPILYLDGRPVQDAWEGVSAPSVFPESTIAVLGNRGPLSNRSLDDSFAGSVDEFLLLGRAMSPMEVEVLFQSKRPYGSIFTEDIERGRDFSDVRVVQVSSSGGAKFVAADIVGVRPGPPPDMAEGSCYLDFDGADDGDPATNCSDADDAESAGVVFTSQGPFDNQGDRGRKLTDAESYFDITVSDPIDWTSRNRAIEFWFKGSNPGIVFEMGLYLGLTFVEEQAVLSISGEAFDVSLKADDLWHHVAITFESPDLGGQVRLFVDGLEDEPGRDGCGELPIASLNPGEHYFRFGSAVEDSFEGLIDDFVFHSDYRHAEEIRRRATPALPVMRFEVDAADTGEGEACPARFHEYRLVMGNEDVTPPSDRRTEDGCIGVLSRCHGYLGWWRFDDDTGTAWDATSNEFHFSNGACSAPDNLPGLYGQASLIDEGTCLKTRVPHDGLHRDFRDGIAIEAIFDPRSLANSVLMSQRNSTQVEWEIGFDSDSRPIFSYTADGSLYTYENTDEPGLSSNGWVFLALSYQYGDGTAELFIDGEMRTLSSTSAPRSPPNKGADLFLGSNGIDEIAIAAEVEEIRVLDHELGNGEALSVPPLRVLWPEREEFRAEPICVE